METIFHEKQQGLLCAQHCLNNLLQAQYFTAVELAEIAKRMDEEERMRMAEAGVDSEHYRRFIEQPSGNMDDSGYFSVQVISAALVVWSIELVPFSSSSEPLAIAAKNQPENMTAYICNYRDHWFTIRKLGRQWFNLNSLLSGPELISETYLSIYLVQLQQEGYSIFVVKGELPQCAADSALMDNPAVQVIKPKLTNPGTLTKQLSEESELQKAIKLSLGETTSDDSEEALIEAAIQQSLQEFDSGDPSLNRALELSLQSTSEQQTIGGTTQTLPSTTSPATGRTLSQPLANAPTPDREAEDLEAAMRLSLQQQPASSRTAGSRAGETVDAEEVRRRRLAYLESKSKT